MDEQRMTAAGALRRLREGNRLFREGGSRAMDCSADRFRDLIVNGQHPFAAVIACSDSRVIPEAVFSADPGDLFVIRVAGNVLDSHQLGSVEYAVDHLGCPLVVVMGHTRCGAVHAALSSEPEGYIRSLTDVIRMAAGEETDEEKVCALNAERGAEIVRRMLRDNGLAARTVSAVFRLEDGTVSFLDPED